MLSVGVGRGTQSSGIGVARGTPQGPNGRTGGVAHAIRGAQSLCNTLLHAAGPYTGSSAVQESQLRSVTVCGAAGATSALGRLWPPQAHSSTRNDSVRHTRRQAAPSSGFR
jgi:hypothetical protein